ncbi:hypothetical protein BHM03_00038246 [Ensete ventricosum]|nr:hypothetical protein BHM03_00038246 [Ensete ventricosum]
MGGLPAESCWPSLGFYGFSVSMLVPIVPLDRISFKLNRGDLHLGFLRSPGVAARGDYDSKGGWLQPSAARWGGIMGDSDAVEGWKAAATTEEAAIVADDSYSSGDIAMREWAAAANLRWSRGRGSSGGKQGSSNGGGGLHGS